MNKHDQDNLNFIMSLSIPQLRKWADTVSADDIDYAIELMKIKGNELMVQEMEFTDIVDDVSDAKSILDTIRKKNV